MLFAARANFHVRLVKEFGWGLLYEIVAREAPDLLPALPSLEQASGVCEICRDLNVTLADKLAPIYEPIEIEYVRTRAEFEWRSLGGGADPDELLRFGDEEISLPDLRDRLGRDRSLRLDYLGGLLQIARTPPLSADHHRRT
jgi:hypothetical protein